LTLSLKETGEGDDGDGDGYDDDYGDREGSERSSFL
jgi:hypothetical protein